MATSFTLATLKSAIQGFAEDSGADFAGQLDMLIQLAEDRVLKDLPLSVFDALGSVSIAAGTQTASKPSGAIAIQGLSYINAGTRTILEPRTYSFCLDYSPTTTQATPKYFAEDYSSSQIWIAPNPNVTVTAEAVMTKRPNSLVTDTTGTFISTNIGDLLLAACLISAEQFNIATEQAAMWQAQYAALLASAQNDFKHLLRRGYSPLAPQPVASNKGER